MLFLSLTVQRLWFLEITAVKPLSTVSPVPIAPHQRILDSSPSISFWDVAGAVKHSCNGWMAYTTFLIKRDNVFVGCLLVYRSMITSGYSFFCILGVQIGINAPVDESVPCHNEFWERTRRVIVLCGAETPTFAIWDKWSGVSDHLPVCVCVCGGYNHSCHLP